MYIILKKIINTYEYGHCEIKFNFFNIELIVVK